METKRLSTLWVLVTLVMVVAACAPAATTEVKPTVGTTPSAGSASSTPEPTTTAVVTLEVKPVSVTALATVSASSMPEPTATAVPVSDELDCMGACHEVDINELFGPGVKPQPASHKGRTACLECHATLAKPALPSTHLGRLDAACTGCHKSK